MWPAKCVLSSLFPAEHICDRKLSIFYNMVCLTSSIWFYKPTDLLWKVVGQMFLPGMGGCQALCLPPLHGTFVNPLSFSASQKASQALSLTQAFSWTEPGFLPGLHELTHGQRGLVVKGRGQRAIEPWNPGDAENCLILIPVDTSLCIQRASLEMCDLLVFSVSTLPAKGSINQRHAGLGVLSDNKSTSAACP